jgi:hypothetical protein
LYGFNSFVDVSKLHISFVAASGDLLDGPLEDRLRFLFVLVYFEQIGIAHDQYLIIGIFVVGKRVEVLCLFVVEGLILFLSHLEEGLEGEFLKGFDRHQQQSINNNNAVIVYAT